MTFIVVVGTVPNQLSTYKVHFLEYFFQLGNSKLIKEKQYIFYIYIEI